MIFLTFYYLTHYNFLGNDSITVLKVFLHCTPTVCLEIPRISYKYIVWSFLILINPSCCFYDFDVVRVLLSHLLWKHFHEFRTHSITPIVIWKPFFCFGFSYFKTTIHLQGNCSFEICENPKQSFFLWSSYVAHVSFTMVTIPKCPRIL